MEREEHMNREGPYVHMRRFSILESVRFELLLAAELGRGEGSGLNLAPFRGQQLFDFAYPNLLR